jgi:hypothetical protein
MHECCLNVFNPPSATESGLLETREVALVEGSPTPETALAEKPLAKGDEYEKDNCHARLCADSVAGIRPAEFNR